MTEVQTQPQHTLESGGGNSQAAGLAREPRRLSVLTVLLILLTFNLLDQDLPEFDPLPPFELAITRSNISKNCKQLLHAD